MEHKTTQASDDGTGDREVILHQSLSNSDVDGKSPGVRASQDIESVSQQPHAEE